MDHCSECSTSKPRMILIRFILLFGLLLPYQVFAKKPVFEIIIKDHLFYPSEFEIPSGIKIKLVIINQDNTSEEFESYELNREKIVMGNSKAVVFIGPLEPGVYPFFGEFNVKTAQGVILVK